MLTASPASVSLRVSPEYSVLREGVSQKTVIKIIIEGADLPPAAERVPLNLALVVDTSGSMSGERIVNARLAALEVLSRLDENDIFSLITYDSTARVVIPAGPIEDRTELERIIGGLQAGGMTALYGGIEMGAAELRKHQSRQYATRMLMISDGRANIGPSRADDLGALGAKLGAAEIVLSTVGLGLGYNEDLMTQLADRSGGNAYFVEGAVDLPRMVDLEIGQALSVVANGATLRLQLPKGMRPLRLIGRSGAIEGQFVEASLPPIYRRQARHLLLEVEIAADATGAPLTLQQVDAEVVRSGSGEIEHVQATPLVLQFSPEVDVVEASLNPSVQTMRLLDEIALARDQALRLQDAGDSQGAAAVLRDVATRGQAAPVAALDAALAAEFEAVAEQSKTLNTRQLDNRERKVMRASSYQQLNRQAVD